MYICSEKKKKLFCAFIDYKKAFDSMQRGLLWGKLLNSGVNGKVLRVIRDMYAKAKSCVKTRHGLSQFLFYFLSQTLVCVRGKICRQFCFRCF